MMNISIEKNKNPKQKPDWGNLGFGQYFTDHMFIMDYDIDKGWYDPRIVPYADLPFSPALMVFHYGQAIFEGLKAYRTADGGIKLFRPRKNMERVNISNERMCIPPIDEDFAIEAVRALVNADLDWVPSTAGTSLYIRPFIIATDPFLGVRASHTYKFIIILSPVGAYYPEGIDPVKIYVETEYVRAVKGGVGFAKTPANYAASLKAQLEAKKKGYTQVLWLDGVEKKYIEEVGTMNVFFNIGGEIITPALNGSILPGVTRDSAIELLKSWNVKVTERALSIDEVCAAVKNNTLREAFGTGTAAVISPIGELKIGGEILKINDGKIGQLSSKIYDALTGIQYGTIEDTFNWMVEV